MKANKTNSIILFFFVFLTLSCASDYQTGSVKISFSINQPTDIVSYDLNISADDMDEDIEATLTMNGDDAEGVVFEIPAGENRLFTVEAYDDTAAMIFHGSAIANVQTGQLTTVPIVLVEINPDTDTLGDAQINGFDTFPVIESLTASAVAIYTEETINLAVLASDPDNDELTYLWSANGGSFSSPTTTATEWTAPLTADTYTLTVTVDDDRGGVVQAQVEILVNETSEFDPSNYTVWVVGTSSFTGRANIVSYLSAEGYQVEYYKFEADLVGEDLNTADILIMPGGGFSEGSGYESPLELGTNSNVQTAVRNFVSSGGHYIGICGGAISGSSWLYATFLGMEVQVPGYDMLGLLDVKGFDNMEWMDEYMTASGALYPFNTPIQLSDHPIVSPNENTTLVMAYRAGPVLKLLNPNDPNIDVIGTFTQDLDPSMPSYDIAGQPAIVAGSYGNGHVVLFSTHPEYSYPQYQDQTPPIDYTSYMLINAARWVIEGD